MVEDDAFEALADACITAGETVMEHGSPDMKTAMRALLYSLAREIARREAVEQRDGAALSDEEEP